MTIYNINLSIGWASSGVEYAQLYRAKNLRNQSEKYKFIFLEFFNHENIQSLTENLGFLDEEIIWLYQYFTDVKIAKTTYTIENIIGNLGCKVESVEDEYQQKKIIYNNGNNYILCELNKDGTVKNASYVSRGKLIRKDFFSFVKMYSEFYAPTDNMAKLYMREFYNQNGSIAYTELIMKDKRIYVMEDSILYSKQEFVSYFIDKLDLDKKDIILLDRSSNIAQSIIENKGEAKVGVVIHAEHFNKHETNDKHILWNNFYEYVLNNPMYIDFYITATEKQNEILKEQFRQYYNLNHNIYTIPVGCVDSLCFNEKRKPYSIITASRLANEKHLDWLIKAVLIVQKIYPKVTLDIFGEGIERENLKRIISENKAEKFINIKGHHSLDNIYSNYELYLTASTSEGFGLTLMEAVSSGLGLVGFDVNYGNTTFIKNGYNGYSIPMNLNNERTNEIIDEIALGIIKYFESDKDQFSKGSYNIAKQFMNYEVQKKWNNLIKEVLYD